MKKDQHDENNVQHGRQVDLGLGFISGGCNDGSSHLCFLPKFFRFP